MTPTIELQPAQKHDTPHLSRLLYEYQKELLPYSEHPDAGVQPYKYLPDYFTDPTREAFFIVVNGEAGGFVMINMHTILEGPAHSIAEFYVMPKFRRRGIGERAAELAFAKFPGEWEVAQMEANQPAIQFWRSVIDKVTRGDYSEIVRADDEWRGPIQRFTIQE